MFLLVPAYPGCPGSKAVKRSLLLLLFVTYLFFKFLPPLFPKVLNTLAGSNEKQYIRVANGTGGLVKNDNINFKVCCSFFV